MRSSFSNGRILIAVVCVAAVLLLSPGCKKSDAIEEVLAREIVRIGGVTNALSGRTEQLSLGNLRVERDAIGSRISMENIEFSTVSNVLAKAYGQPIIAFPAEGNRGPVYAFPPTVSKIVINLVQTATGLEVTVHKPVWPLGAE